MENFSKNEKRKRGRPAMLSYEQEVLVRSLYPEHGPRARRNLMYLGIAFRWIKDDPSCAWLIEQTPGGRFRRGTLLQELGRIADEASIIAAAHILCEHRPTVRGGLLYFRHLRQSRNDGKLQLTGNWMDLATLLGRTINDYLHRYPETPLHVIRDALEWVAPDDE